MRKSLLTLLAVGSVSLFACASNRADDVGSNEQHATADIDHMFKRPDGRYDVTCADGTQSTLTAEQINQNMACGGPHNSGGDGGVVTDDDDDDNNQGATCLSKDPIDATQYGYAKASAPQTVCTTAELTQISAYYRAHAADNDFTTATWAASVSAGCAACVFTDVTSAPAATWGPIVTKDGQLQEVNRGGCMEIVSGSEACGRTYQQFQDCTVDACLKDCTTQADFTKCRQDVTVLTTSCKDSFEAVKTACDETKIGAYETKCKGTTYTFEGPIKRACVANP